MTDKSSTENIIDRLERLEKERQTVMQKKKEREAIESKRIEVLDLELRKDLVLAIMIGGHESDKKHPWDRAQQLMYYIKNGAVPKPGLYHGFKY